MYQHIWQQVHLLQHIRRVWFVLSVDTGDCTNVADVRCHSVIVIVRESTLRLDASVVWYSFFRKLECNRHIPIRRGRCSVTSVLPWPHHRDVFHVQAVGRIKQWLVQIFFSLQICPTCCSGARRPLQSINSHVFYIRTVGRWIVKILNIIHPFPKKNCKLYSTLLPSLLSSSKMCPTCDASPAENSDAVHAPLTNDTNGVPTNGVHSTNGKRGTSRSKNVPRIDQSQRNPYAPRASDFLSNVSNFNIIESTLRGFYPFLYLNLVPNSLKKENIRGGAIR